MGYFLLLRLQQNNEWRRNGKEEDFFCIIEYPSIADVLWKIFSLAVNVESLKKNLCDKFSFVLDTNIIYHLKNV